VHLEALLSDWRAQHGLARCAGGCILLEELEKSRWQRGANLTAKDHYLKQQAALLGILSGGTTPTVGEFGEPVDTSRLLVLATGAFSDAKWANGAQIPTPADLVRYGLLSEVVDRFSEIIALPPASVTDLSAIYQHEETGALAGIRNLYEALGYDLEVAPEAYRYAAQSALEGGRAVGPRAGAGWIEAAAKRLLSRALREGRVPGPLMLTPDEIQIPRAR
jgi:hypothetical protein